MAFDLDDLNSDGVLANMRGRIPWLPQHRCTNCGAMCTAEHVYVERQAAVVPVWSCESCDAMYHREHDGDRQ